MSWRSGSKLFVEMWPLIQAHVSNKKQRQEFLASMLRVFLEWDIDPYDVADVHPEVAKVLQAIGAAVETGDDGDDVAICAKSLKSRQAEKDRVVAAKAIEHFVHQSAEPARAAALALKALVAALRDESPKVRRAAANSMFDLVADGFAMPKSASNKLQAALKDDDPSVRKTLEAVLRRLKKS